MEMKTKVKVLTVEGPIHWPSECARCCALGELQTVHMGIARDVSSLVDRVQGTTRYQTMGLHYPACNDHAAWAAFASWLTRKSPLPNLLRAAAYLIGPLALLAITLHSLVWLLQVGLWFAGNTRNNPWMVKVPDNLFLPLFLGTCAALLVLVVWAFRSVPVRLLKLEDDAVLIRFTNERFARHFLRANAAIVVPSK